MALAIRSGAHGSLLGARSLRQGELVEGMRVVITRQDASDLTHILKPLGMRRVLLGLSPGTCPRPLVVPKGR